MRRPGVAAVGLACCALLAACGTRLPDSAFVEQNQVVVSEEGTPGAGDDLVVDDGGTEGEGTTDSTTVTGDGGGATGGGTTGSGGSSGGSGGASAASRPNQASDIGVTPTEIVIGTIVAENGVLGDAFAPAARGMRAWAAATNAKGGIAGRKVVLKTCDDREARNTALACAQRLVEQDKVFAIVGANTRAMGGAAQYLNDKGVPVMGMPITNSYYRYPHFWSIYESGYKRDGQTVGHNGQIMFTSEIYRWFKDNLKLSKAAVVAYDIDESKQAGAAFAEGLELEGFSVTSYAVSFAAPSFDQAVADMQQKGVEIIVDTMDDGGNRKLCDSMARRNFKVEAKVSTVVSFGDRVGKSYNDTCRNNVYIPGESQPYTATDVPAIAEFRAAFARYQPGKDVHQWALEAWGQAQLVKEALEKMGPTPTRKGLEDYFRSLKNWTGGGIFSGLDWNLIDYDRPTNEGCTVISRWQDDKGGWVRVTNPFPFCYPDAKQYGSPALEQGN